MQLDQDSTHTAGSVGGAAGIPGKYSLTLVACSSSEGKPSLSRICFGVVLNVVTAVLVRMVAVMLRRQCSARLPLLQKMNVLETDIQLLTCDLYTCTHQHTHKHTCVYAHRKLLKDQFLFYQLT